MNSSLQKTAEYAGKYHPNKI